MNVENLRLNHPKLIGHLESSNYSKLYIARVRSVIDKLLKIPNAWGSYLDLYLEYESNSSRSSCPEMKAVIGTVMRFDLRGEYPNGKKSGLTTKTAYGELSTEFKKYIDYYFASETNHDRLQKATMARNASCTSSFLLFLQNSGVTSLTDVNEDIVLSSFVSNEGVPLKSQTIVYCIKDVFKVCTPLYPSECKKLLSLLPSLKRIKKNFPFLTKQESQKIAEALKNEAGTLPLRDKAIGVIAYYTGLRWCDIASLKLDSIDWERDLIVISQQKTDVPLELPLTATVGNAIYDYLTNERPDTAESALFLTYGWHPRAVGKWTRGGVSAKIWKAADIRQNKGEKKGLHIFRHNFATTLLEKGIPQPIISSVMGQLAPESLEPYLSADMVHLKECALSIASFPNAAKEVFGHE